MTSHNVHPMFPAEDAFTNRTASNYSRGPHTAADYGLYEARSLGYQRVSLAPPPSVIYRRNQMRRTAIEVIGCVVCLVLLVWMAVTPDDAVVRAQMEDVQ